MLVEQIHEFIIYVVIPNAVRQSIYTRPQQILGVVEIEDMCRNQQFITMCFLDHGAVKLIAQFGHAMIPVIDPYFHQIDTPAKILTDGDTSLFFCLNPIRSRFSSDFRSGDAASCG